MIVSRILIALALLGAALLTASPAEARIGVCSVLTEPGNCGFHLVCVGTKVDDNGRVYGCTVQVDMPYCDPGACELP